jgi:hypothetical protein
MIVRRDPAGVRLARFGGGGRLRAGLVLGYAMRAAPRRNRAWRRAVIQARGLRNDGAVGLGPWLPSGRAAGAAADVGLKVLMPAGLRTAVGATARPQTVPQLGMSQIARFVSGRVALASGVAAVGHRYNLVTLRAAVASVPMVARRMPALPAILATRVAAARAAVTDTAGGPGLRRSASTISARRRAILGADGRRIWYRSALKQVPAAVLRRRHSEAPPSLMTRPIAPVAHERDARRRGDAGANFAATRGGVAADQPGLADDRHVRSILPVGLAARRQDQHAAASATVQSHPHSIAPTGVVSSDDVVRIMRDVFADDARRPPAGVTGFDNRLSPIYPGRKPGF